MGIEWDSGIFCYNHWDCTLYISSLISVSASPIHFIGFFIAMFRDLFCSPNDISTSFSGQSLVETSMKGNDTDFEGS
jgi:hypothetical protein